MEVVCLQDGSRSFRVRWKDMWLHEQYITAYPDLLNEFCNKQKDLVTGDDHSAVADVTFEHMAVNGAGSSDDNDTYPIHPFLLQVGDDKTDIDNHDVFDNPISSVEDQNSNDKQDVAIGGNGIKVTDVISDMAEDSHNDLNFTDEVNNHVLSLSLIHI